MKRETTRQLRWPFCVALFILIVPVLYVLSIGPAAWLMVNGYINDGTLHALYDPLILIDGKLRPPLGEWIEWYLGFWV